MRSKWVNSCEAFRRVAVITNAQEMLAAIITTILYTFDI